jgi:hypothetical protein
MAMSPSLGECPFDARRAAACFGAGDTVRRVFFVVAILTSELKVDG